jgi:Protein of unknown function (DUF2591)
MKTSELTGTALDWAVAKCEGYRLDLVPEGEYKPSADWAQGGPIIERENIAIDFDGKAWTASDNDSPICHRASTPLVAAMRCFVASKLGDEIEVPKELAP